MGGQLGVKVRLGSIIVLCLPGVLAFRKPTLKYWGSRSASADLAQMAWTGRDGGHVQDGVRPKGDPLSGGKAVSAS